MLLRNRTIKHTVVWTAGSMRCRRESIACRFNVEKVSLMSLHDLIAPVVILIEASDNGIQLFALGKKELYIQVLVAGSSE